VEHAIAKAKALTEAYEYILRFKGKVVIVKVGGSIMDQTETLNKLLADVCFMHAVGMRPILVHGGGNEITAAMKRAGLEAQFVQGRRYTDERTLAIVEDVLVSQINKAIVDQISSLGSKAMALHSLSSCVVFAKRLLLRDPEDCHRQVDLGYVGEVEWVNSELLKLVVESGTVPVIAPIARDATGGKLNVNADSVAGHVAMALDAEKLVLVSDTHGIRTSNESDSLASHVTKAQIQDLARKGVITAGMLPKVEASIAALEAGVTKVHIIDGRIPHSLMLEIYTSEGIGTELVLK
jgi:acetylglutamate kinase